MKNVEIERKFLVDRLPSDLDSYPYKEFEQGYLSTEPVLRVRHEGDEYFATYKSAGFLERVEYNMPLTKEAYYHLREKTDGIIITKRRYRIPAEGGLTIELDVFSGELAPLVLAEVEFDSAEEAKSYSVPEWFGREVTYDTAYSNSTMSSEGLPKEEKNE